MKKLFATTMLAATLTLGACASNANQQPAQPDQKVVVQVRNDAFWDATVYLVLESTQRIRVGTANGNATTNLTLPRSATSGLSELRFLVDWIGRPDRSLSDPILASPGDTILLQIR